MITEEPTMTMTEEGSKVWAVGKRRHRIGAPAVIHPNGCEVWWFEGKRHRSDGPAVYGSNTKKKAYYLYGKNVTDDVERMRRQTPELSDVSDEIILSFLSL